MVLPFNLIFENGIITAQRAILRENGINKQYLEVQV